MSHTYRRLLVHLVFSTKYREPTITKSLEKDLHNNLKEGLEDLGCKHYIINGTEDHVHLLFELNNTKSVSQVAKHIKGKSSYLITETHKIDFAWQTGYSVYSVGQTEIDRIFNYIKNQKDHHKTIQLDDELKAL